MWRELKNSESLTASLKKRVRLTLSQPKTSPLGDCSKTSPSAGEILVSKNGETELSS